jgi:hypothetical protein
LNQIIVIIIIIIAEIYQVGTVTGYGLEDPFSTPGRSSDSSFTTPSRPALVPTQPSVGFLPRGKAAEA